MAPLRFSLRPALRRLTLAGLPAAILLGSLPSHAEWTLQTIGSESATYETNPLLLAHGAQSLYGSNTAPEIVFKDETPTRTFSSDTTVNYQYFDHTSFNTTDVHEKIGFDKKIQRWEGALPAQFDYDSTRTSELTNFNRVTKPVQHLGYSFSPDLTFEVNPVDKLGLAGYYTKSEYDKTTFQDYQSYSITPSFTHSFDPKNTGIFQIEAQRYQTVTGPNITVETVGPSIGWVAILTPRLSGKATVGVQESQQYGSGAVARGWSLNNIFSGNLDFNGQEDTSHLLFSRSQYPFNNGTEALLTSISLTDTHNINENFSLNLGGSYQYATYQASANGNFGSMLGGNGGLAYHVTQHVDLTSAYQYRRETLTGTSGTIEDHTITIGIVYRPEAWTL